MSIIAAFQSQAVSCASLGSPFTGRLMTLIAAHLSDQTVIGKRLFDWPGDVSSRGDSVPLRLAGALHRLVLTGQSADLAAVYPPHQADGAALWSAVNAALTDHQAALDAWLDSPPQTNEVRRAAALIPAFHLIAKATGLPLRLTELGASAGLNLLADRFFLTLPAATYGPADSTVTLAPDWTGPHPMPDADLAILQRSGVDLRTVDLSKPDETTRLISYLWADQPDRIARTQAAIALAQDTPPKVVSGDAAAYLDQALSRRLQGQCHVVYNTIAWQYFPLQTAKRAKASLARAGRAAKTDAPLFHLAMEADDQDQPGAALTLQCWPDGETHALGRVDFHGRWVDWTGPTSLG